MNFVRVYDAHSQAREKLFEWIRPLSQEQYVQSFPFGLHTPQTTRQTDVYTAAQGDLAAQLLLPEVHHRAQAK